MYTWEQAVRRVRTLARDYGIWPGIVADGDGFRLLCDPQTMTGRYEQA